MDNYQGYRSLAAAIVLQACVDYVNSIHEHNDRLRKKCEEFFSSEGPSRLCGIDGMSIMKLLHRQQNKARRKIKLWEVLDALEQ